MKWSKVASKGCALCEELADENGITVGHVVRFFDDAPTNAWAHGNRLGAFSTDESAKAAVEAEHKRG